MYYCCLYLSGTDSWAFGMLLWAIVHRKRPFTGWEAVDVVKHILDASDDNTLPVTIDAPPPGAGKGMLLRLRYQSESHYDTAMHAVYAVQGGMTADQIINIDPSAAR